MAFFCNRCMSLLPPGSERCSCCGAVVDVAESKQKSLTDILVKRTPKLMEEVNQDAPYLPYEPRPMQLTIISDIRLALNAGKHIVMESGTGTGKTIISLSAALEHAIPRGKKVIYLTRTISQSDQVMRELKAISSLKKISGVAITGRGKSCPLLRTMPGYESIPSTVHSSLCESKKAKRACPYFNSLKDNLSIVEKYCKTEFPTSEKLDNYCEKLDTCPYEMKKLLMKDVDVVVAPYIHILSEDIRSNLLRNMNVEDDNILIVIDEAHNIIDAAREQESFTITMRNVEAAIDECSTMKQGGGMLWEGISIRQFFESIKQIIRYFASEKLDLKTKEALLKPQDLEERLFKQFLIKRSELDIILDRLIDIGETRTEMLMERGENRISDIFLISVDLKNWITTPDDRYIKSIKTGDSGESIHASCINPNDVTLFLRMQKGAVHMSGTLQPLDQYIKVLGLPSDTVTGIYPSPFPKENRSIIYMDNVTTRYQDMQADPSIESRIFRNIAKMCNAVDKNTLVFFPSYSMMRRLRPFLERDVRKNQYWEEQGQPKRTMLALSRFRQGRGGVFFSVMGGSIAEGIDFPGDELCFAIIVGIPFPPPTLESKAMSDMFDQKYGQGMGWRYVSLAPAMRKMKQAIGRLIRTESDRGMAVIMDSRVSRYTKELEASLTKDPVGDVVTFFEKK